MHAVEVVDVTFYASVATLVATLVIMLLMDARKTDRLEKFTRALNRTARQMAQADVARAEGYRVAALPAAPRGGHDDALIAALTEELRLRPPMLSVVQVLQGQTRPRTMEWITAEVERVAPGLEPAIVRAQLVAAIYEHGTVERFVDRDGFTVHQIVPADRPPMLETKAEHRYDSDAHVGDIMVQEGDDLEVWGDPAADQPGRFTTTNHPSTLHLVPLRLVS